MSQKLAAPERQAKEIKKWLIDAELTAADIGREAGLSIDSAVKTINGFRNSSKVLLALVSRGCPVEYLDLPEKVAARLAA